MQAKISRWIWVSIAILAITFSACKKQTAKNEAATEGEAMAADKVIPGDKVAVVNGTVITKTDFDREMKQAQQRQLLQTGQPLNDSQLVALQKEVLEILIGRALLFQESQNQGIKVEEAVINGELEKLKKRFPDEAKFKETLEKHHLSETILKAQIEQGLATQQFIEKKFVEKVTVSDKEAEEHYNNNPDNFKTPEQIHASHILIKVDPQANETEKTEAHKKLEDIQQKLKKGEDFAALAKEFSQCPSSIKGGDLGYFGRGQMVKPFEETAFALKPGTVSDIVETRFGYHLIKAIEKKPASTIAFEKVKDKLKEYLKQVKADKEVSSYVEQLKAKASVERFL